MIEGRTDAQAAKVSEFSAGAMSTRGMIICVNTTHSYEHYGNLVTYLRLNKIVPPSSGD